MIVPLVKVTAYGLLNDKERVIDALQEMGCLHLIPLRPEADLPGGGGPSLQAREALRFLLDCPHRRRQVKDPSHFDAPAVERQALDLQVRIQALEDERDFLRGRIANLRPWGEFAFPPREELKNLRLWFYVVPHNQMRGVEAADLIWEEVHRDNRFSYVAVVSEREPQGMPVERTRTGDRSISDLEKRLEEVELGLEDLQAERASLTRWCYLFARSLNQLEDQAARVAAARQTYDESPLFALQAWAPRERAGALQSYADKERLALVVEEPGPGDTPPTLLRNAPAVASGQDLVSFYMTPGYWLWDPSASVFFSFAVFFAMILSDAGYALVLGLGLALGWRRMGRSDSGQRLRRLLAALIGASAVWGALVGSYFGLAPAEGGPLATLQVLDMKDFPTMMRLSISIGVLHLVLANAANAWRYRGSVQALAPMGWILIFVGGISVWLGLRIPGLLAMGLGGAAVLTFTVAQGPLWKRLLGGLQGLTRLSGAFGDTLSYLRLFALGLASASLAMTFNDLAGQVHASVEGIGLLFALLIAVLGHAINFLLGISSGVIHGLRLNFIEFFNWGISSEGYPFKAFTRKEK